MRFISQSNDGRVKWISGERRQPGARDWRQFRAGSDWSCVGDRDVAYRHHSIRSRRRARTGSEAARRGTRHCRGGGIAAVFYGSDAPAGANPDVPVADSVRVVLVTGPNALKYFNDYRSKVAALPIAGLGDKAYYDGYASLSVLKGDEYLRVAVIGVKHVLQAEERLAAGAVPRM